MLYQDLPEESKERERRTLRERSVYPHDGWWDGVYNDAIRMGELLGINTTAECIYFSGFWSQGDGACFQGSYMYEANAVSNIMRETAGSDLELLHIAEELTTINVKTALKYGVAANLGCEISAQGHYCHSGMMHCNFMQWDIYYEQEGIDLTPETCEVEKLIRSFADWIYEQLEAEYDHLMSDESIDAYLADQEFDEELDDESDEATL